MELTLNNWNVTALRLYFLFLGYSWCYKILLNWWFSSSRFPCVGLTLLSCYDSDHTLILLIHVWFCDQNRIHLDRVVLLSLVAHLLKRQFFIGELRYPMLLLVFPFTNLFIQTCWSWPVMFYSLKWSLIMQNQNLQLFMFSLSTLRRNVEVLQYIW